MGPRQELYLFDATIPSHTNNNQRTHLMGSRETQLVAYGKTPKQIFTQLRVACA